MAEQGTVPRLCSAYLGHPCLIGALYGGGAFWATAVYEVEEEEALAGDVRG